MTQDNEQYRAGFEAWFKSANEFQWSRAFDRVDGDYRYVSMETEWAFRGYVAGKREASTEPSAKGGREGGLLEQAKTAETRMDIGSAGGHLVGAAGALSDDAIPAQGWCTPVDANVMLAITRAGQNPQASSSTDDAEARYSAYVAKCQQGRITPCTFANFQAEHARLIREVVADDAKAVIDAARKLVECKGRYHSELNFKALAAAIEAHTKEQKP